MKHVCTCSICRRTIRNQIERTFRVEPRWMGLYTIRFHGRLGWVPMPYYRSIIREMLRLGLLLKSRGPGDPFRRYLSSKVLVPAQVLAESTEGGQR